jgi:branched-chain amino acid transport system permease protein
MAGVAGAFFAAAQGGVAASNFDFFVGLPIVLLAVVGGIGTAGGALFAGLILVAVPLVTSPLKAIQGPLRLLPGLVGIGLGKNPNGAVSDIATAFRPLEKARGVVLGMVLAVAGLFALRTAGVLPNWWFGILAVVVVFAAPGVAQLLDDDLVELDRALVLSEPD